MFQINKVLTIQANPVRRDPVAYKILQMCETLLNFRGLSHVDYRELPQIGNKRRFAVKAAYGVRDK